MSLLKQGKSFYDDHVPTEWLDDLGTTSQQTLQQMNRWSRNIFWDLKGGTQIFTVNGVEAEFDAETEDAGDIVRWTYQLEEVWLRDLLSEFNRDDRFFDVGGNIGFYACFSANYLTNGSVVSFEPLPPNAEQLRDNLAHNSGDATVRELALADTNDTVEFTVPATSDVGHATGTIEPGEQGSGYTVRTRRGDELVATGELPQPTVVKVDVEGSEPLVLEGMKETLSSADCRLLYCEIHLPKEGRPSIRDYDSTADEVKNNIRDLGFDIESIDERTGELHVKARK